MKKQKIIFLDRDGVINIDKHYLYKIEDFEFTDNIFKSCKHFISLGYKIIIITNQSGIGRNYFTKEDFKKLSDWMLDKFKQEDIEILDLFYCPHEPSKDCDCRKPKIGMIKQACSKYSIDLENSWLIGDKISDIQTAINAKIKNHILINSEYTQIDKKNDEIQFIVNNIEETIKIIQK